MTQFELSTYEQKLIQNVEQHGCQVTHVFDNEERAPNWSYSIGFAETLQQPDAILFGLHRDLMQSMINELYARGRDGLCFAEGLAVSGLIDGFDCILRTVHPSNIVAEYFSSAMWYYRFKQMPHMSAAYQIVWPGAHSGKFPWESGCAQEIIDSQPSLYEDWTIQ
jgi:Domain of unknown function (DUF4262)